MVYLRDETKNKSYKKIRLELKKILTIKLFLISISLNIKNIIVLKNYYRKNNLIVCIKPLIGNYKIIYTKNALSRFGLYKIVKKDFNVFEEFRKEKTK